MKKLFNHTKRPDRNWDEDVQDGYDWDEEAYNEESDDEYYADGEEMYNEESDGEEYYADSDETYSGEVDGEEYYADGDEGYGEDVDGDEYYADGEETYSEDADDEEYYADGDEAYSEEADGEEYYADGEEAYNEESDGEEYYAADEEAYSEEIGGEEYYADGDEAYSEENDEEAYYAEDMDYEDYDEDTTPARTQKKTAHKKSGAGKLAVLWTKFLNMSTMDRIMTATGVAVLILAIVTGSVYASARIVDGQVSEFVSVGTQLDGIQMIGEQGLLAVADAQMARIAAANAVEEDPEEQTQYDEAEYTNGGEVVLELVSVQKDLKIKFNNKKTGKLVANVPFTVTITDPNGKTETWTDDDMDGIIYKKGITPGNYSVAVNALSDEKYKDYTLPVATQKVEVRKDIAYKKVDVSNEIKKESEINAAKEDTQKKDTVVESVLQDTVQWVASTTTANTYKEVSKDTITNPETVAYSGRFLRTAGGSVSLAVGDSKQLKPEMSAPTGTIANWTSDNTAIATVDGSGNVTAVKAGTTTITYSYTIAATPVPTPSTEPSTTPSTEPSTTPSTEPSTTPSTEPSTTPSTDSTTTPPESASPSTEAQSTVKVNQPVVHAQTNSFSATGEVHKETWTITVTEAASASLENASVTVAIGKEATTQIKVANYTGAASYKAESKDGKIATANVDANGRITVKGVAAGDTTVTVTVTMGSVTKTLDLSVKVTGQMAITLDKTAVTTYPKATATINATVSGSGTVTAVSSDTNIATVSVNGKSVTITGVKAGSATITVTYTEGSAKVEAKCTVTVKASNPREDKVTKLKDKSGQQLYIQDGDKYREAVYADYFTASKFFVKGDVKYTGWQTLDGKVYFFTAEGNKVTGEQVIQGAKYNFASDGSLVVGSGTMGIDVSKWNGSIDWNAVKNSGVSYVIIRVGYRGSSQGSLIDDPTFKTNIKGATAAGIKVGVYFFTQAVDEVEAVQEASMVLDRISGYKISYPVFLDVEGSGGRGDKIDSATRTAVCKAFCNTIQNAGYTAGIYANKTWLTSKMDAGALSAYKIWLAQYASTPTYTGRYDLWQYRSTGKVSGISGNVDLNLSYLGY